MFTMNLEIVQIHAQHSKVYRKFLTTTAHFFEIKQAWVVNHNLTCGEYSGNLLTLGL